MNSSKRKNHYKIAMMRKKRNKRKKFKLF
jgi:hypothetical protein